MVRRALIISLVMLALATLVFIAVKSEARDIYVDDSYPYPTGDGSADYPYQTIQHAIDVAEDGDTIYVFPGTYNETLVINKKLTLQGLEKDNTTICKNDGHRYTIEISADYVTLEDFTIHDTGGGCRVALIYVTSDIVTIQGNTINGSANVWAIYLDSSNGDTIGSNTINGSKGIFAGYSSNIALTNNEISNCYEAALYLQNSDNDIIYGNNLTNSPFGIYAKSCSNINITNNTIESNTDGIDMHQGSENFIYKNTINNNANGIDINSQGANIKNNTIAYNGIGIQLGGSTCKIYGNTITHSTSYGIYASVGSSDNTIYENHFSKNNINNAIDNGNNQWDSGAVGNYWDDYNDVDRNLDGIGDFPYHVPGGGIDRYPTGKFLQPPDKPTDPSPEDGASNVGLSPTLSVKVSDPDSDSLTVYFYKATDDTLIAERHGVPSGGTASCTFNLPFNTVMAWYVVVNDSKLEAKSDPWVFTTLPIPPTNSKPTADPGGPYTGKANVAIHFDGTNSNDPDGTITFYRWNFGDGSGEILDPTPTHIYTQNGTYTVTLTVIDNDGTSDTEVTTATIGGEQPNQAPKAVVGGPYSGKVNEVITFDGSASYDLDGNIESYFWNFGDGETASGATVTHSYSKADTYTVTLTVTDDDGATDSSTTFVTITEEKKTPGFEVIIFILAITALVAISRRRM